MLKVKEWKNISCKHQQKKSSNYVIIADNVTFQNMENYQEYRRQYITINMYAPRKRASKYMKKKLTKLKGDIDKSIILLEDFNISLSGISRKRNPVRIQKSQSTQSTKVT